MIMFLLEVNMMELNLFHQPPSKDGFTIKQLKHLNHLALCQVTQTHMTGIIILKIGSWSVSKARDLANLASDATNVATDAELAAADSTPTALMTMGA